MSEPLESQLRVVTTGDATQKFSFDYVLFRDKLLDAKTSCKEMGLKPGDELLAIRSKGGSGGKAIMWRRYPTANIRPDSTWYMPTGTSWDVLKFVAKRPVRILGQGACGPVRAEHYIGWVMGIKYRVNDQDSPVGDYQPTEDDMDEFRCFKVFYRDIGLEPFDVPEGGEFFIF